MDKPKLGVAAKNTGDISTLLYRPSWWRWDSWQFHALIIGMSILLSTPLIVWSLQASEAGRPLLPDIVDALTNTTNLVALVYAIYIYYLYDRSKTIAETKMREKGIPVVSLEEGLGTLLTNMKKAMDWMDKNKDNLQKIQDKMAGVDIGEFINHADEIARWFNKNKDSFKDVGERMKGVDISQMVERLDSVMKFIESMQQHGFTKERFEKLLVMFEKVDLDKAMKLIEDWNKSQEAMRQLDEVQASLAVPSPPAKPLKCLFHPRVDMINGKCPFCVVEEKLPPLKRPKPPLKRGYEE